jgi:hypothetical protein
MQTRSLFSVLALVIAGCGAAPANDVSSVAEGLGTPICPGGGAYCGNDGVTNGDANTLYQCPGAGRAPSSSQSCASGCIVMPAGTPDVCAAGGGAVCPGGGAYCGSDGVQNGDANTLYQCPSAGRAPTSSQPCASGCVVMPPGQPDVCAGGLGCTPSGQAALAWEASQLGAGNSFSDMCLLFVYDAYQAAGNLPWWLSGATAAISLSRAESSGAFTYWNGSCPCGAVIYWPANGCNGSAGHVAICNGDGTVSTSGWPGFAGATHHSIGWMNAMECGASPAGYIRP